MSTTRDHRSPLFRDGVIWRWGLAHDPDVSDLARAVGLSLFDDHDTLPAHFDAAQFAAIRGISERDVDLALDALMDDPGWIRVFPDGAVFLSFDRRSVHRRARHLATARDSSIGRVLRDAERNSAA